MKTLLIVSMVMGLGLGAGDAYGQDGAGLGTGFAAWVEGLPEAQTMPRHQSVRSVCNKPGTCLLLGTVLTGGGLVVSGLGVSFLLQLKDRDTSDDLATVPVVLWGGMLLLTGVLSTGVGLHLIGRSIRLKRLQVAVGWRGVPQAGFRLRF